MDIPKTWLATLLLAVTSTAAGAPCEAPEHRQFDFWVGEWQVLKRDGSVAGTNSITREFGGCVLRERYRGSAGYAGESLNVFDAGRKQWHQTWVDNGGTLLLLDGALRGGEMVLEGSTRDAQGKETRHRITWTPNPDGTVRQHWQKSEGSGSWATVFDGLYRRVAD